MEKERKGIDSKTKFSGRIKGIVAALLLALGSSSFSYAQENDTIQDKIDITNMESYQKFHEEELARALTLKDRNSIFQMLVQLFSKDDRYGFPEFDEIDKELEDILSRIPKDEHYVSELDRFIADLDYLYSKEKNDVCRLAITRIISRISDEKITFLTGISDKFELFVKHLRVGDLILMNKKLYYFDLGSGCLKVYDNVFPTDFTHAALVAGFPDSLDVIIRHSTTETEKSHNVGVEETSLLSYLFDADRCDAEMCDMVILRPRPEILKLILDVSKDKIGCDYDNKSALLQGLGFSNNSNDKYNCVELFTQSIDANKIVFSGKNDYSFGLKGDLERNMDENYEKFLKELVLSLDGKTFPTDLLKYSGLFKTVYMTSIRKYF